VANITGCRGARLLVWLILNDRVQPSLIAGVEALAPTSSVIGECSAVQCSAVRALGRMQLTPQNWLR
jgi:hypothetical protein